jgi:hypothetical protein
MTNLAERVTMVSQSSRKADRFPFRSFRVAQNPIPKPAVRSLACQDPIGCIRLRTSTNGSPCQHIEDYHAVRGRDLDIWFSIVAPFAGHSTINAIPVPPVVLLMRRCELDEAAYLREQNVPNRTAADPSVRHCLQVGAINTNGIKQREERAKLPAV